MKTIKETCTRFVCGPLSETWCNVGEKNNMKFNGRTGEVLLLLSEWIRGEGMSFIPIGKGRIIAQAPGPMWGDRQTTAYTIEIEYQMP